MKTITRLLICLIFSSAVTAAYAAGPATKYEVKVKTFELYNGASWITVFEGESGTMDIASVESGLSPGEFMSGLSVPDGTYTQLRVTPHPQFVIRGNDGTRYTLATNGPNNGCTYTTNSTLVADCTITLTGANEPPANADDISATPITVKDGVADKTVRVAFDVSGAVSYNAGADELFPAEPVVTMTIQ